MINKNIQDCSIFIPASTILFYKLGTSLSKQNNALSLMSEDNAKNKILIIFL